jgi:hypothetical protein
MKYSLPTGYPSIVHHSSILYATVAHFLETSPRIGVGGKGCPVGGSRVDPLSLGIEIADRVLINPEDNARQRNSGIQARHSAKACNYIQFEVP